MTLEEQWIQYRNACYPPKNGPISKLQETETRQAFFAGCLVAINVVADGIRNHAPVDAVKNIKALRAEADAVCRQRIYEMRERN